MKDGGKVGKRYLVFETIVKNIFAVPGTALSYGFHAAVKRLSSFCEMACIMQVCSIWNVDFLVPAQTFGMSALVASSRFLVCSGLNAQLSLLFARKTKQMKSGPP